MYWHSSRSSPCHRLHLRNRLLQAHFRFHICKHYSQQEPLGLRFLKIHQYLDCREGICAANHDEHVLDYAVVRLWYYILGMGERISDLDKK